MIYYKNLLGKEPWRAVDTLPLKNKHKHNTNKCPHHKIENLIWSKQTSIKHNFVILYWLQCTCISLQFVHICLFCQFAPRENQVSFREVYDEISSFRCLRKTVKYSYFGRQMFYGVGLFAALYNLWKFVMEIVAMMCTCIFQVPVGQSPHCQQTIINNQWTWGNPGFYTADSLLGNSCKKSLCIQLLYDHECK